MNLELTEPVVARLLTRKSPAVDLKLTEPVVASHLPRKSPAVDLEQTEPVVASLLSMKSLELTEPIVARLLMRESLKHPAVSLEPTEPVVARLLTRGSLKHSVDRPLPDCRKSKAEKNFEDPQICFSCRKAKRPYAHDYRTCRFKHRSDMGQPGTSGSEPQVRAK